MNRTLRYSSLSYQSLRTNPPHQFAAGHALQVYRGAAVYSFIPKNACSTLRLSLALENGCIKDAADYNWIHHNNDAFLANLPALINASYTFVLLRCPFARVASAFLDKIVGHTLDAWQLYDVMQRKRQISTFTFDFFVKALRTPTVKNCNIHWRPQVDFLVYEEYDDYFCVEDFGHAVKTLQQKIGLAVVDARKFTAHGLDNFEIIPGEACFAHASALEIMNLKAAGKCPSPRALFSPELVDIVREIYQKDIDFYVQQFGAENLLFPPQASSAPVAAPVSVLALVPEASAKPLSKAVCCNICGEFYGAQLISQDSALQADQDAASCPSCAALPGERALRHLLQALPCGFLSWRRGLQIGQNRGLSQVALRSLQCMPSDAASFAELASFAAGSMDLIAVCEDCEDCEDCADWMESFAQLSRLLSADGLLLLDASALAGLAMHGNPESDAEDGEKKGQAAQHSMRLQEIDPCTGREMTLYLFSKNPRMLQQVKQSQAGWRRIG